MALGYKLMQGGADGLFVLASFDAATGISAAGTTQITATELTNGVNFVSTVAANSGVILSSKATAGDSQIIFNGGANPLKIYPMVGAKINALATNIPVVLGTNSTCEFWIGSITQVAAVLSA